MALHEENIELAHKMLQREEAINQMHIQFKESHINRLNQGNCHLKSGFIFLEYLDNMEKIGDRLTNIAQSVIGKMKWGAEYQEVAV